MEVSETRRGPAPSLLLRDLVLKRLQKHLTKQGLLPKLKSTTLPSSHKCPSVRPKPRLRLACEAKRCLKWSPFEDLHRRTLTTNGPDSRTQRKSPTGGVYWKLHPDFLTDSWSSRMIRDVGESSFRWSEQRERLVKQVKERCSCLTRRSLCSLQRNDDSPTSLIILDDQESVRKIGSERVTRALAKRYYWHKMKDLIKEIVMSCHDCQVSRMHLQRLSLEFAEVDADQLPLPR
jgi:hypothetical protein